MTSCESHGEQFECKSVVSAKGRDHPGNGHESQVKENQVKSKSVVFPKGGDVDAVSCGHQEQLLSEEPRSRTP